MIWLLSMVEFLTLHADCNHLLPVCLLFRYRMLYAMKLNDSIDLVWTAWSMTQLWTGSILLVETLSLGYGTQKTTWSVCHMALSSAINVSSCNLYTYDMVISTSILPKCCEPEKQRSHLKKYHLRA